MKNILDITETSTNGLLTVENSVSLPEDTRIVGDDILTIQNSLGVKTKKLDECTGILTFENTTYIDFLKLFYIDSVKAIGVAIDDIKNKLFKKKTVFTFLINDLDSHSTANNRIKELRFSKYEKMLLPVMLGTDSDYLTISNVLKEFPKSIDTINNLVLDYTNKIERMLNSDSEDRLMLKDYEGINDSIHNQNLELNKLVDKLVNPKSTNDLMRLEHLLPNFNILDNIKDNFKNICKEINSKDLVSLEHNISLLVNSIAVWSRVVKKQGNTRHSKQAVRDFSHGIKWLAESITTVSILLTSTQQFITFYNRSIVLLENKVS